VILSVIRDLHPDARTAQAPHPFRERRLRS
jgi:hypothetical protein